MTRLELLKVLVRQARINGFEFRKWYTGQIGLPWTDFEAAIETLSREKRYYGLLFSHEFAKALWKDGEKINFVVPNSSFTRLGKDGQMMTVERKSYTRRSGREGVWRYHLQQLVLSEEPLRYMRRYLAIPEHMEDDALSPEEDFEPEPDAAAAAAAKSAAASAKAELLAVEAATAAAHATAKIAARAAAKTARKTPPTHDVLGVESRTRLT